MNARSLRCVTVVVCVFAAAACDVNVLKRAFDNPVDSTGTSYQGYPTVGSTDEIAIAYPADGGQAIWPVVCATECLDADAYHFQIAESEASLGGTGMLVDAAGKTSNVLKASDYTGLETGTTYYWRARAHRRGDSTTMYGPWTDPASFVTDAGVTGISPPDGATVNSLALSWGAVSGAGSYEVQTASAEGDVAASAVVTVQDPAATADWPANAGSEIYWRVRPVRSDGLKGFWSATWSFTVQIDTGITIDPDPQNPVSITFAGQSATLAIGSTMTVTATTSEAVDSYQWYLNGEAITGATSASVTVGSGLQLGNYRLTLVVLRGGIVSSANVEFAVTTPPHQLVNDALAAQGLAMRVVPIIAAGSSDTYRGMTLMAYALSETEVTQGDYQAVRGSNPSSGRGVGTSYPVYYVSWYDAVRFCDALSVLCGLEQVYNESTWVADFTKNGFYLPTEAQWEYAAGGPSHTTWSLGDTFVSTDYVYADSQTRPVKSHAANGFGLYDMSGNVWEWCHDWYASSGWPWTGQTDPNGPGSGSYRVLRGGNWGNADSTNLRCDDRASYNPSNTGSDIGFRVAVGGYGLW